MCGVRSGGCAVGLNARGRVFRIGTGARRGQAPDSRALVRVWAVIALLSHREGAQHPPKVRDPTCSRPAPWTARTEDNRFDGNTK
jgi:hypothetical protein